MKNSSFVLSLWIAICASAQAIVTSDELGTHVVNQMDDTYGIDLGGVVLIGGFYPEPEPKDSVQDRSFPTAMC